MSQVGINIAKIAPGSISIIYRTCTTDVGRYHESYSQLLSDAELKHFFSLTSIQTWLSIKPFTQTTQMRVALKVRNNNLGYGSDPVYLIESDTFFLLQPTNIEIIVPKNRIYFVALPAQIPPTSFIRLGPNALPRAAVPYGPRDDFIVPLDLIRRRVLENWN